MEEPELLKNETFSVESVNFSDSNLEVESGTFEDLAIDHSSTDIDAENYSIHSFSGASKKMNDNESNEHTLFHFLMSLQKMKMILKPTPLRQAR
ncbi:MAG: hypothetical protein Ct9H300mP21_01640 [Pseudomonadota bacterium]|nr:MAG: hypothetical protein Ct9H300mP21_01640 [Pseudomonadota bacterium]